MARTQSPDHQLQRDEILERAAQAFAANGYPGTSMNDLASACGTSKARLYHYYPSKDAILFDLLDRYTKVLIHIAQTHAGLPALIEAFLIEYEHSQTRHMALLNDVKFLEQPQRNVILDAQRQVVDLFTQAIQQAYPQHTTERNRSAVTMLLFGMINWTFTWLKPDQGKDQDKPGKMSYKDFAQLVTAVFMHGMDGLPAHRE
ncbi:TetR/AcrR family transcriptional regulator [Undibacterium sp.]|jgi:AcrR family transcriptional regulator|uniref:TetR/AcrR family transcriptional regulator n=1 Tax=Undibacterium sp. TaxID=1914977 RepID=UPI002BBAB592|nr:TetR/AcrR family transcriptional regulator [Undibacterium sp.]HTD04960.1 TetR/AcrR family transcriptional regulator [Undibacterium sp.]